MTIRDLKEKLATFSDQEEQHEVVFCHNPTEDICEDYTFNEDGVSLQYDRASKSWKAVFYLSRK